MTTKTQIHFLIDYMDGFGPVPLVKVYVTIVYVNIWTAVREERSMGPEYDHCSLNSRTIHRIVFRIHKVPKFEVQNFLT